VIIIDLSDVSFLDDTIALAIENLIKDANQLEKHILMLVKQGSSKTKLQKMGFAEILPPDAFVNNRTEALTKATDWLHSQELAKKSEGDNVTISD
jgi:SulP family sulfate permease